jgi:hypothetical protein
MKARIRVQDRERASERRASGGVFENTSQFIQVVHRESFNTVYATITGQFISHYRGCAVFINKQENAEDIQ